MRSGSARARRLQSPTPISLIVMARPLVIRQSRRVNATTGVVELATIAMRRTPLDQEGTRRAAQCANLAQ